MSLFTERPSPDGESDILEGILTRKHEWESTTKKASNRYSDDFYHLSLRNYKIKRVMFVYLLCFNINVK